MSSTDYTLETLLDLDGEIYIYPTGHWHKIEARKLRYFDEHYPQGIKYSLTLHTPTGERILGYDNAHSIPGRSMDRAFDHVHKRARVISYQYKNATQLLADFFNDIEVIFEFEQEYEYEV